MMFETFKNHKLQWAHHKQYPIKKLQCPKQKQHMVLIFGRLDL